jgi:hypothetical protein
VPIFIAPPFHFKVAPTVDSEPSSQNVAPQHSLFSKLALPRAHQKKGSSRFSGKRSLDRQKEIGVTLGE